MKDKIYILIIVVMAIVLIFGFGFDGALSGNLLARAAPSVGYVAVPAAAFYPMDDTYSFYNSGDVLYLASPTSGGWFNAPVTLPHGAALNKFTYYWYDSMPTENTYCQLKAYDTITGVSQYVSYLVESFGSNGKDLSYTDNFYLATVDNSRYFYYIDCLLFRDYTPPDYPITELYGIRIEYTYPVYAPLVVR